MRQSNGGARRAIRLCAARPSRRRFAHLGKAIEMADKGATARRAPDGSAAPTQRLTPLRVAYGNALFAARGTGAPETTQAFARARELASGEKDAPERLATDYGLWVGSYTRGELASMRAHAAAFLSDVEASPDSPETSVAHRAAGTACWFAGEYREARDHLERALALFQPGRDDDLAFRFGLDPASAPWAGWRFRCGLSAMSTARFRSSTACRRGSRASPMSARLRLEECTRPCSN